MKQQAVLAAVALCAAAGIARAAVVTQWNFNSSTPDANTSTGTLTPNIGAGTASLVGGTTSTFASGDASGGSSDPSAGDDSGLNVTTYPAASANNETAGVQFAASTAGFTDIVITFDMRHSNTSSRYFAFYYSTDGVNFTRLAVSGANGFAGTTPAGGNPASTAGLFGSNGTWSAFDGTVAGAGDDWFNGRGIDLTGVPGVSNNPNFAFRIVSSFDAGSSYAASSGGTYSTSGTTRFDMVTINGVVPAPGTAALALLGVGAIAGARRRK